MIRLPLDAYYREPHPVPAQACPRCGHVMRTLGELRLHLDRRRDPAERRALHGGYGLSPAQRAALVEAVADATHRAVLAHFGGADPAA